MRSSWLVVLGICSLVGCGSVGSKPDASPGGDGGTGNGTLTLAAASSWVPQTQSRMVDFTIARDASSTGALTVHVANLPTGVTAADVAVAAGASSGTLTFAADASSTLGSSTNVDVQLLDGATKLDSKPFAVKVSGLPGTVDTTFGTGGKAVVPLPDPAVNGTTGNSYVRAMLTYPASAGANADKILVGAEIDTTGGTTTTYKGGIIRLDADGSPDTTFGGGAGYVLIDGSPANGFLPVDLALDSQGRIVVAAYRINTSNVCTVYVTRLLPSGAPDPSFTTFDEQPDGGGYCGNAWSVAVLPGDKILIAATWNNPDYSQRPLLLQLNSDGTRDGTAFGSSSAIRVSNPDVDKPSWELTRGLAVDSNGSIYIEGAKCDGGWNVAVSACESVVGRLTSSGTWDTSFGTAGTGGHKGYSQLTLGTTSNASLHEGFEQLTRDAAGNIVLVGYNDGYTTGVLARFTSTGAADTTFATGGHVAPTFVTNATVQELDALAIDSAGNILVAGYANNGSPLLVTSRYTPTGVLDRSWGTNGVQTTAEVAIGPQAAVQSDDRFLAGGGTPRGANGTDVAVWRYW